MVCARVEIFGRVIASNLVDQLHGCFLSFKLCKILQSVKLRAKVKKVALFKKKLFELNSQQFLNITKIYILDYVSHFVVFLLHSYCFSTVKNAKCVLFTCEP